MGKETLHEADQTGAVMDISSIREGIHWQADHAEKAGAGGTARVIRGVLALLDGKTATGRRVAAWQGAVIKDAMPLRIHGGLHNLVLTGEDRRLEEVYARRLTDQASVDAIVCDLVEKYDHRLLPWLDGPPQTNEAGRSSSFIAGLAWLAGRVVPRFEMLELGASAGINTMMDRSFYDLGGVHFGPADSPMHIVPEWRGDPQSAQVFEITSIRGCDIAPVDLSDPDAALRLKSYVWPEAHERMARIYAAAQLAALSPPDVVRQDAAEFVEDALSRSQMAGTTRVLFHSIVWQYIPADQQKRIEQVMGNAAARASDECPLAWMQLETNRETFRHELSLRYWPGGEKPVILANAHPHGAWVEWLGD